MTRLLSSAQEVRSDPADPAALGPGGTSDASADLRAPMLGLVAWGGALLGLLVSSGVLTTAALALAVGLVGGAVVLVCARSRAGADEMSRSEVRGLLVAAAMVLLASSTVASIHRVTTDVGPLANLVEQGASIRGELVVTADPREREGRFGGYVVLRGELVEMHGRGRTYDLHARVLVIAPTTWADVPLGARVALGGTLGAADGDLAAVLRARGEPETIRGPDAWWGGAARVREALRASVDHRPDDQAVLVPSLVVGDDAGLDPDLARDFQMTGLTHLLAVSGTNLTLMVGFLLVLGGAFGIRGRWRYAIAVGGIVGFVLLARTEPSVVRAAAMGTVALVGLGRNGLRRGTRSLGIAVVLLLLVWPWLATTVGFALSVLATAGILFLAPRWRDALADWMPRWLAEAIAVPAAAQLACTPVVAAISGEVSLVAVVANMLVAPVVGPATVLGLSGGLIGLVSTSLSRLPGTMAAWCVAWIIAVAQWGAALPVAAVGWGTSALALALLVALCAAAIPLAPRVLRSRVATLVVAALTAAVVLVRVPDPWWPPDGWVAVACDVGQGDGIVLRAAHGVGIVIDTGADPAAIDRCLDGLGIDRVALLVLTHFHDDHAGAVQGVLEDRVVDLIEVSPLAEPAATAREVAVAAGEAGIPVEVTAFGSRRQVGEVALEVIWPEPVRETGRGATASTGAARADSGEGSDANDASIVLVAEVQGVRLLLTGDIEPGAQRRILRSLASRSPALDVDVLKVPHHGSRSQELDLLLGVRPEVALISVGADNTYGHPNAELTAALQEAGAHVHRTDLEGDLVVVRGDHGIAVISRGAS